MEVSFAYQDYENSELLGLALSCTREVELASFEALPRILPSTFVLLPTLLLVGVLVLPLFLAVLDSFVTVR